MTSRARLTLDPLDVRRINLYGIDRAQRHALRPSGRGQSCCRRSSIASSAAANITAGAGKSVAGTPHKPVVKRGLALTPVKFGIAFTSTLFNQAGALLQVYTDGTVLLNHGGTEMGQGLHVKVAQVVAAELGLPLRAIRISATDTSKVPNTSATAASSGSDLNGKAAQAAAITFRERLTAVACQKFGVAAQEVRFADGHVQAGTQRLTFAALARSAHEARVSLSATGYYRTPKIHWDRDAIRGSGTLNWLL